MVEQLLWLRDRHGWDVSAIIAAGDGDLRSRLEAHGIRVITFDFARNDLLRPDRMLAAILALESVLAKERFDVVQTHLFISMVIGRLAAWLADVPVRIAMIAGPYHLEAPTPRWIDTSTAWMETVLIGSCAYTNQLYRDSGIANEKLRLVYYGADETKFDPATTLHSDIRSELGWPAQTPLIGMVAYFYPVLPPSGWTPPQLHGKANKRHEDLIKAMPIVRLQIPQARLLLVGSAWGEAGALQVAKMKRLVADLALQDVVHFTGFRNEVNALINEFDVSVQVSLSENLGGAIESLLMQRPVVASRTGGLVDAVIDHVTGLVVPPEDVPALATAIIQLLKSPEQAHTFARAGRVRMLEHFTLNRTAEALDAIYREKPDARGYRWIVRTYRHLALGPVSAYLGGRLLWEGLVQRIRRRFRSAGAP